MRKADLPFLADWFVVSLRWLTLLGLTIALAEGGHLRLELTIGFLVYAGWNIFASVLAIANRRLPEHRFINVTVDFLASVLFFYFSRGALGPIPWTGLLALFSVGIYYELLGGLVVGGLLALVQSALIANEVSMPGMLLPLTASLIGNVGLGAALGLLGHKVIGGVRGIYQAQVNARQAAEQRVQKIEHDRMQAFYRMTQTLSATLSYQAVLDTALDLGTRVVDDDPDSAARMVSAVLLFENDQLKIGCSRRLNPADLRVVLPGRSGILAQAVESADPQVGGNPPDDPELCVITALRACHSTVCMALRTGLNVYGILLFAHPEVNYFSIERCEVLEVLKTQSIIAIQNALLYQDLEREKTRLLETQEEARRKLARDLHDGPTQSVAAIAMRINLLRRLLKKDPQASAEELAKIEELANRTTKEIRHMLFTLRPLILESQGLAIALQSMAEKTREAFNQEVSIQVESSLLEKLEIGKQTVIFYIVEEAVNNARKHAAADHIWVRLAPFTGTRDLALLEIKDDGKGFNVDEVNSNYDSFGSLGLVNLRERSELVNGLLDIQSEPGKGTQVNVYIPLSEEAADRLHRSGS